MTSDKTTTATTEPAAPAAPWRGRHRYIDVQGPPRPGPLRREPDEPSALRLALPVIAAYWACFALFFAWRLLW